MRIALAAFIALFLVSPAWAAPVCAARDEAAPALSRLQDAMAEGRIIAYQPTELAVWDGNPVQASEISIREDLRTLRPWFDGLVTYASNPCLSYMGMLSAAKTSLDRVIWAMRSSSAAAGLGTITPAPSASSATGRRPFP